MSKLLLPKYSFIITLISIIAAHILILVLFKYNDGLNWQHLTNSISNIGNKIKIDKIDLLTIDQLQKIKKVGIKNGKNNLNSPDLDSPLTPPSNENNQLDLKNLGVNTSEIKAPPTIAQKTESKLLNENKKSGIYFDYKKERVIKSSKDHEEIKTDLIKNLGIDKVSSKANKISNFDIRIERPEGVPEDQLNADEKAFYSFYKRTYTNYISKLFSTYSKVKIERPGIDKAFDEEHLLIAKIDYDENGNIITIKIIKSSKDDNIHYFFEEALKNLNIPNPPKIFIKKQNQFSIYYQVKIN